MSIAFEDKFAADLHAIRIMLSLVTVDHLLQYDNPIAALAALADSGHASANAYRIQADSYEAEIQYREAIHERIDAITSTVNDAITKIKE